MNASQNKKILDFAIEFKNVTKKFGATVANNKISFSVPRGTIRALVGENGAGKSTAMKILFGLYKEDSGEILVHGKSQHWRSPRDAIRNGIGMVHQHFMLAETATALDNIILGDESRTLKYPFIPTPFNVIDRKKARCEIEKVAKQYGFDVPLDKKVNQLSVSIQQRIEILKLLYRHANILIFDEPTAVLTPLEVDDLFKNLKKLKDEGKTVVIVTHKLQEVLDFTDDITVFRSGQVVGEIKTSDATEEKIAAMMVGRSVDLRPKIASPKHIGAPILQIKNLGLKNTQRSGNALLKNLNFNLHSGEIVGIAGIEGNGQSALVDILLHPKKYFCKSPSSTQTTATGEINVFGGSIRTPEALKQLGNSMAFIPEDRHRNGLLLQMNAEENYLLGRQNEKKFCHWGLQNTKNLSAVFKKESEKYDIRPRVPLLHACGFSGGNQQKIIIAREFGKEPRLIVASNPTRGVDIGSIEFIHQQIVSERNKGVGILLISSELSEITTLSDRILVFYGGSIVAEFTRGEANEHLIGLAMCGSFSNRGDGL